MEWIRPIALIVAGVLAASALVMLTVKRAQPSIEKLVRFQGYVGVGLLAWGIYDLIWLVRHLDAIGAQGKVHPLFAISLYAAVAAELLLGFFLGMPLIARWIPGKSAAEQRALAVHEKLGTWRNTLGLAAIAIAVILVYYNLEF